MQNRRINPQVTTGSDLCHVETGSSEDETLLNIMRFKLYYRRSKAEHIGGDSHSYLQVPT